MTEGENDQPERDAEGGNTNPPEDLTPAKSTEDLFRDDVNDAISSSVLSKSGVKDTLAAARPVEAQAVQKTNGELTGLSFNDGIYASKFTQDQKIAPTDTFSRSATSRGLGSGRVEIVSVKKVGGPAEPDTQAAVGVEADAEAEKKAKPAPGSEADAEAEQKAKPAPAAEADAEAEQKAKLAPATEADAEAEKKAKPAPAAEADAEADKKAKPAPATEADAEAEKKAKPAPAAEADAEADKKAKPPAADSSAEAEKKPKGDETPPPEKTPAQKMLDPNTSNEEKIKIADEMYRKGEKSFKGPDGRKYEITEAKAGERRLVGVFTSDENGNSKAVLRGIVEKDGKISQQQDSKGRKVDYESNWSKKNDGAGLRNPEKKDAAPADPNAEKAPKEPKAEQTEEQKRAALKPDPDGIIRGIDERDGSKFERKADDKGGYVETHTGDKPEQNYTKSDDGKGNIIVNRKDGTGYTRTEESPGGPFNEAHFGPNPSDFKTVRGDGKGNGVETTSDPEGGYTEKYTFADASKNYLKHTLPDSTVIEVNGKGRTTTSGDGKTITFEGNDGRKSTEIRTENGFTKTHTGPNPEDNWSVEHKKNGNGYTEQYTFKDSDKSYKKDVTADGKTTVTDNAGLQIELHQASQQFREKMLNEIQKIPAEERKRLADAGYKVAVVSKISDVNPALAKERPPGWPDGKTWDDVDGAHMSDRKLMVVAEKTNSGPSYRGPGVLRHAMGGAMDRALGNFSQTEEFKKAYQADVANLQSMDRYKHGFLLQKGAAGPEQAFANVYGAMKGASSNPMERHRLLSAFPLVSESIKKKLNDRT